LKAYQIKANDIIRSNKNKLIKFSNLLKSDMVKYKTYPYITSIFGDNVLFGKYQGKNITIEVKYEEIHINIENNIQTKVIPKYFEIKDINVTAFIKGDYLYLKNKSRSDMTINNIRIRNMGKYYYLKNEERIPYETMIKINLKNEQQYLQSKYMSFKKYNRTIENQYGLHIEYKKDSYREARVLEKIETYIVNSNLYSNNVKKKYNRYAIGLVN
jgi:hypothetical protein